MNTSKKFASSIALLVSFLMLWNQGSIVAGTKVTTVKVVPDYPGTSSFSILCQSKDDDLGGHVITRGSSYSFSFKPNVLGSTLFHCEVDLEGRGLSFEIYSEWRDFEASRCIELCLWRVRHDGVLGYKEGEDNPDLFFRWTR